MIIWFSLVTDSFAMQLTSIPSLQPRHIRRNVPIKLRRVPAAGYHSVPVYFNFLLFEAPFVYFFYQAIGFLALPVIRYNPIENRNVVKLYSWSLLSKELALIKGKVSSSLLRSNWNQGFHLGCMFGTGNNVCRPDESPFVNYLVQRAARVRFYGLMSVWSVAEGLRARFHGMDKVNNFVLPLDRLVGDFFNIIVTEVWKVVLWRRGLFVAN